MMQDQATQVVESLTAIEEKHFASKGAQTSLQGDELEALQEFMNKNLETQSKFEVNLR